MGLYAHHFSPAFSSLFSFRVARWPQAVGEHCRKVPTIDLKEPAFDGSILATHFCVFDISVFCQIEDI